MHPQVPGGTDTSCNPWLHLRWLGTQDKGPQLLVAITSVGTGEQSQSLQILSWRSQSLRERLSPLCTGAVGLGGRTQNKLASLPKQLGLWRGFGAGGPSRAPGPRQCVSFLGALQKHRPVRGLGHEMPTTAGSSGVCRPHSLVPSL